LERGVLVIPLKARRERERVGGRVSDGSPHMVDP